MKKYVDIVDADAFSASNNFKLPAGMGAGLLSGAVDVHDVTAVALNSHISSVMDIGHDEDDDGRNMVTFGMLSAAALSDGATSYQGMIKQRERGTVDSDIMMMANASVNLGQMRNALHDGNLSFKNFNPQESLKFTLAIHSANAGIEVDPVIDAFLPIITVAPNSFGVVMEVDEIQLVTGLTHGTSGAVKDNKVTSLLRKLDDASIYGNAANALYPVVRASTIASGAIYNPASVVGLHESVTVEDGMTFVSGPVAIDKKVNFLSLTQPDESAARGETDFTDALSPNPGIKDIVITMTGKDVDTPANDLTESMRIKLPKAAAVFTPATGQGVSTQSFNLVYISDHAIIRKTDVNAAGTVNKIKEFDALPEGSYVKYSYHLSGTVDLDTSDGIVSSNAVVFDGLFDSTGTEITSDEGGSTILADITAVIETLKIVAYYPDLYKAQDNFRQTAPTITHTKRKYGYPAITQTLVDERFPVGEGAATSNKSGISIHLRNNVLHLGIAEILNAGNAIKSVDINATTPSAPSMLFNPTYERTTHDVVASLNNTKTHEKIDDVKTSFELRIRSMANLLSNKSGYLRIFSTLNPGKKPTVIIGTTPDIGAYVKDFSDGVFNYEVNVTSAPALLGESIIIGFGRSKSERGKEPSVFDPGFTVHIAEPTIYKETRSTGASFDTITHPVTVTPYWTSVIQGVIDVEGLESIANKTV